MMSPVRCSLVASNLWHPVSEATVTLIGTQSVRWRKPRWLPVAKSKMFRIPERKYCPPEEEIELRRLNNNYKAQMKAVRHHLIAECQRTADSSELAQLQVAQEEAEHQELMEYNRQENLRVAALREERVRKEYEADLARLEASKEKLALATAKKEEEALRIINETQELVKTFIEREDLEQAIEAAMANPVDYNFAINQDGYIFRGRNTKPEDIMEEDREKLQSAVQV